MLVSLMLFVGCSTFHHNTSNMVNATNVNFSEMKKGTNCKYFALGLIPLTNDDIDVAAKQAKIKKLKFVEYSAGYYVLFSKRCVVVYGE